MTISTTPYRLEPPTIDHSFSIPSDWYCNFPLYQISGNVHHDENDLDGVPVGKNWVPRGGLVLQEVYHSLHLFARDIRVIGIRIYPKDINRFEPKFLVLGPPDFIQLSEDGTPADPGTEFDPHQAQPQPAPLNFQSYNATHELKVKWESRYPIFKDKDGESNKLTITQRFIFSPYSSDPPHEPPGGLKAARIFPLIYFKYVGEDIKLDKSRLPFPSEAWLRFCGRRRRSKQKPSRGLSR